MLVSAGRSGVLWATCPQLWAMRKRRIKWRRWTKTNSDEEEDEEDKVINEEVNIEFEAYSISDNDYDGIKKLLQQLFLKAPVNIAELTDLLVQQNHIGSVINQTDVSEDSDDVVDEDEIFGFISLLNLTERKGTPCAEQIKELILHLLWEEHGWAAGQALQWHRQACGLSAEREVH